MNKQLKVLLWVGLGAGVPALAIAGASARATEPTNGTPAAEEPSRVCVAERPGIGGDRGWHPAALALVLASTPEPDKVLAALDEQLELAEESNNPMALDLEPPDGSDLKRLRSQLWPRVNAAQALLRPELERKGHALVACDDPSARYALWRESGALPPAPPAQRQQAWATVSLALVRSGDAERLRSRLRARSAEPDSAIAIVVGPLAHADGVSALGARAKRLAERAQSAGRTVPPMLSLLAGASDAGEVPLALGAGDLVVVPRLAALARLPEFSAEIEGALDAGDRFVHRPEPLVSKTSGERE
jgi:hypothetical protein